MKKIIPLLLSFIILTVSCGPKGATKEDRLQAAEQYKLGKEIVDSKTLNRTKLQKAYNHFEFAKAGYHDDERKLARINLYQGYINYKLKRVPQALNSLRDAIRLNPRLRTPYIFVVRLYILRRQYKSALIWADRGINKLKDPYELHYYKGVAYYRLKNYSQAETQYQKSIDNGAKGNYLSNSKSMVLDIKKLLRSGINYENAKLARFVKKDILTYDDVAKIITGLIPIRSIIMTKSPSAQIADDAYALMRKTKIYNKHKFMRLKYISKSDFAYILCNLIEYLSNGKLKVKEKYKSNPGIPDLNKSNYAFSHSLFVVEANLMKLTDEGNFGAAKNVSGIECINSVKKVKQRYYNK